MRPRHCWRHGAVASEVRLLAPLAAAVDEHCGNGVRVKQGTCKIAALASAASAYAMRRFRRALRAVVQRLRTLEVVASAVYLGFQFGPVAGALQWGRALRKAVARATGLGPQPFPPPDVVAYRWRVEGQPVLSYIAQVCPPPAGLAAMERRGEHILRLPHSSLAVQAHQSKVEYGRPRIPSAEASARCGDTCCGRLICRLRARGGRLLRRDRKSWHGSRAVCARV